MIYFYRRPPQTAGDMRHQTEERTVINFMQNNAFPMDMDASLAEIDRTLDQMLLLAELSASDLNVDRDALQGTLERLQRKINRIADHMDSLQ